MTAKHTFTEYVYWVLSMLYFVLWAIFLFTNRSPEVVYIALTLGIVFLAMAKLTYNEEQIKLIKQQLRQYEREK